MSSSSALELEVLSRVAEDYEAAHTITGDIARDLKRSISEAEVRQALLALARGGLVQAYLYDASAQRYRTISPTEAEAAKEPWFMSIKGSSH
jgi:hypothetical protein